VSRIRFTEAATQDLEEIYDYIALDNIEAAERLQARLQKRWRGAAENPGTGRRRPELRQDLRSVTEGNYLIFYRQIEDGIEIVRISHGARDIETLFEA
jgi:toxin ParE1/3/4